MGLSNNLRNSLSGLALGVFFAGFCWWVGAQLAMITGVGIVWTVAGATKSYVDRTYEVARSKWGLVNGGAVFVASLALLSVHSNSAPGGSPVLLVIIGLSLLSYHTGMAAVHEQRNSSDGTRSMTPVRD